MRPWFLMHRWDLQPKGSNKNKNGKKNTNGISSHFFFGSEMHCIKNQNYTRDEHLQKWTSQDREKKCLKQPKISKYIDQETSKAAMNSPTWTSSLEALHLAKHGIHKKRHPNSVDK